MKEKVLKMEARSQATEEFSGTDLESLFAPLESSSDIDEELAAMKAQLLEIAGQSQFQISNSELLNTRFSYASVDVELRI